jgi:hypothetical protein
MSKFHKFLIGTVAVLALTGPAMAFGPNGTIQPNIPDDLDTSSLNGVNGVDVQCYPPIDRRDSDPVTQTDIDLTFQPYSDFLIRSFVVNHNRASGRAINRDTQYAGTTWKKPGFNEWYWPPVPKPAYLNAGDIAPHRSRSMEISRGGLQGWLR